MQPNSTDRHSSRASWTTELLRLEGAYSEITIRGYRSDFQIFEAWCVAAGFDPLPATAETVAGYVAAVTDLHAPATIGRRIAAIGRIHRLLGYDNPAASQTVSLAMRRMFRKRGRRQRQPKGLSAALRTQLLDACGEDLRGLRDRALIALGYDGLCRRSELVAIQAEDIAELDDGAGTFLIRRSKTDQTGEGRFGYISEPTLAAVSSWQEASDVFRGPLFRAVRGGKNIGTQALHPYAVARIIKKVAGQAGLGGEIIAMLSGHSMRIGAAVEMAEHGIDLIPIMHAGGWKSADMVLRYTAQIDVSRSGMARLQKLLQSGGSQSI